MASLEIDNMEYTSDANAQTAYVTNAGETIYIQQTGNDGIAMYIGSTSNPGLNYWTGQSFTLDTPQRITKLLVTFLANYGTPAGQVTCRIETDSSGFPSGTLANADATITFTPTPSAENTINFTDFSLPAGYYWIVLKAPDQESNRRWQVAGLLAGGYSGGVLAYWETSLWKSGAPVDITFKLYTIPLLVYSEATIKTQGSYALKAVAVGEVVDQQQTGKNSSILLGDTGGEEWRVGQSFKLSSTLLVSAIEIEQNSAGSGSPTGNWTLRIETNNAGVPSGTLADANASIVVTPPGTNTIIKGTFANPFTLTGATTYWIVINCDNQSTNTNWKLSLATAAYTTYSDGVVKYSANGAWAEYDDRYDIYFKVYTYPSLNKTLTKTFAINSDLTGIKNLKIDMRSSRTGSNIKLVLENNTTFVAASQLSGANDATLGDAGNVEYARFQTFPLTAGGKIKSIDIWFGANQGSPSGNVTCRIETVSNGLPSGTLAESHLTATFSPTASAKNTISFTGAEEIPAGQYAITLVAPNQSLNQGWLLIILYPEGYTDGAFGTSTNAGATWASLADRDMKFSVNVKIKHELIPNVITADTFQTVNWDLSAVADVNKNTIDKFIITVVNAAAANTIYLDAFGIATCIDVLGWVD